MTTTSGDVCGVGDDLRRSFEAIERLCFEQQESKVDVLSYVLLLLSQPIGNS